MTGHVNHPSYDKHRPYRVRVIECQEEIGRISFSEDYQFWTLGGPEHYEFEYLNRFMDFAPRSYYTVDRDDMISTDHLDNCEAVVAYPNTEFNKIDMLWGRVGAISYDSTETMLPAHGSNYDQSFKLRTLIDLVRIALVDSDGVALHTNWMIGWANYSEPTKNQVAVQDAHSKWISMFHDTFEHEFNIKHFDGCLEIMEGSQTWMVGMHFYVSHK